MMIRCCVVVSFASSIPAPTMENLLPDAFDQAPGVIAASTTSAGCLTDHVSDGTVKKHNVASIGSVM